MSFSDHDPWNHLDLRIEGDLCWWECESCGADGKRSEQRRPGREGFLGWTLTAPVSEILDSYRHHLAKSHGSRGFPPSQLGDRAR
jgi:hypothetical protein